jgi:acyl-coenzyme A thioesterase PaaI-like protein
MTPNTHPAIDTNLCGEIASLEEGRAVVRLSTLPAMAADHRGLVHGGFVFGAADYAAMLAVNDPNVVLGAADLRFLAPVTVGQTVQCTAFISESSGRKRRVDVSCSVGDRVVAKGTLTAFVLEKHVLD